MSNTRIPFDEYNVELFNKKKFTNDFKSFNNNPYTLYNGDSRELISLAASKFDKPFIDLLVTSPPYNIGKEYEGDLSHEEYVKLHTEVIKKSLPLIKKSGSICWQVGFQVNDTGRKASIAPLDFLYHELFMKISNELKIPLKLKNRIIWRFGHGGIAKTRFSGRYEVVLWYTLSDDYTFNIDDVGLQQKYPSKTSSKERGGELSGQFLGKNPEDVWDFNETIWDIPNVKSHHPEKTIHPCQFPIELIQRLILALTNKDDVVFDPYAGVHSSGCAAALLDRKYLGSELDKSYSKEGLKRVINAVDRKLVYREGKGIMNPNESEFSVMPEAWLRMSAKNLFKEYGTLEEIMKYLKQFPNKKK